MEQPTVPAAARTLAVFEAFQTAKRPLSLSELAKLASIPVSSCLGLIRTLEALGYLQTVSPRVVYPTRRLFDIANEIQRHDPIAFRVLPALQALRDVTGETAVLGARQGNELVRVLVAESGSAIRFSAIAGERKPIQSSALGRVLLAQMSAPDLDECLAAVRGATKADSSGLRNIRDDVAQAGKLGYFVSRGAFTPDVMAIAAPVRLGSNVFGIGIAGPLQRMQSAEQEHLLQLLEAAQALSD